MGYDRPLTLVIRICEFIFVQYAGTKLLRCTGHVDVLLCRFGVMWAATGGLGEGCCEVKPDGKATMMVRQVIVIVVI